MSLDHSQTDLPGQTHLWPVTMREMAEQVAREHRLTIADLKGERRGRRVAQPRQELMYRIYGTGRYSLARIGRFLGGRDHTTVGHGIAAHCERNGLPSPLTGSYGP